MRRNLLLLLFGVSMAFDAVHTAQSFTIAPVGNQTNRHFDDGLAFTMPTRPPQVDLAFTMPTHPPQIEVRFTMPLHSPHTCISFTLLCHPPQHGIAFTMH